MSDAQALLVGQARSCVQLIEDGQLSEALVVLQSLSTALSQAPNSTTSLPVARHSQTIVDLLARAAAGARASREDSRQQLQKLRSVQQVAAVYSASASPQ